MLGSASAAVASRDATDAAGAGARAAEAAAAGVLGDVRAHHAITTAQAGAGDEVATARAAAVVPEVRARAAVEGVIVAVAVLHDPVGLVDAVRGVVAAAGREGEREYGDSDERHVAGSVATAFAHSASSFLDSLWILRSASTTSGCDTFSRSLSS